MSLRSLMVRRSGGRREVADDVLGRLPAVATASGWVWPHWLDRQLDPRSPAAVAGGEAFRANATARDWTAVGNLDSPHEALVDPRGLVTPSGGWSLDWWVGADDRWHVPAREAGVRQRLVGAAPVVETAMRIPSGDAVSRVYGVQRSSTEGGGELVVVEVENASKVPVALALAVRPYGPAGLAAIERIDVADGTVVTVDGRVALLLPRSPARWAGSTFAGGDSAVTVLGGEAGESWPGPVEDPDGLAQAAFVFPLAHGVSLRVALPLGPGEARPSGRAVAFPSALPSAEHVARGWQAQADRGVRIELPDARLAEAVDANRRFLLLRHDGDEGRPTRDDAALVDAFAGHGFDAEAALVLAAHTDRLRADGTIPEPDGAGDATGAALWALGRLWHLTHDATLARAAVEQVAMAARHLDRGRRGGLRRLVPTPGAGRAADRPLDDLLWDAAGLRAAADLLAAAGQPEAATDAERGAAAAWSTAQRALAGSGAADGAAPAGDEVGAAVAALAGCAPLGLVDADDLRVAALADAVRRATGDDGADPDDAAAPPAVAVTAGLGVRETLRLAAVELRAGDRRALARLTWLLDVATPTWTWPAAVHPGTGGGTAGDGHDAVVAAGLLSLVRDLLVREDGDGLALSSLVPEAWLGQGWEVHGAPTAFGRISYAVRWHGDRPALLWELAPHDGIGPVRLTVPGLDPTWSSTERRGEALLAPVDPPASMSVAIDETALSGGLPGLLAGAGGPVTLDFRPPPGAAGVGPPAPGAAAGAATADAGAAEPGDRDDGARRPGDASAPPDPGSLS